MGRTPTTRQGARQAATAALGVALLAVALPRVAGIGWRPVAASLSSVDVLSLASLVALWLAGLLSHTVTLTGALPGLTSRRAITMSLTGSAVSNVLPLGGAAGIALNLRMCRAWGFTTSAVTTYTVVTNVWDVLAKLALPAVAVGVLLCHPTAVAGPLGLTGLALAALAALAVAVLLVVVVRSTRCADVVAAGLGALASAAARAVRRGPGPDVGGLVRSLQRECRGVVDAHWRQLTAGMLVYQVLLAALLGACLHVTGAGLPVSAVVAGFAVERLLTLVNVTPGGAGVVEVGLAGALIGFGGASAPVVAGVLLYRALTFGLEIPVGGLLTLGWLVGRRRAHEVVAA